MSETTASRTLVKSPPELWAECSDASSLGRHLPRFGDIKITKLDPETAVAWEGERVSGTVRIEPSGWGTRVTFTATAEAVEAPPVADPDPDPERVLAPERPTEPEVTVASEVVPEPEAALGSEVVPEPVPSLPPARRRGLFSRLMGRLGFRTASAPAAPAVTETAEPIGSEPVPVAPAQEPELVAVEPAAPEPEPTAPEPEPATPEPVASGPEPSAPSPADEREQIDAALTAALDSLGQAHHRPFSRA